MPVLLMSADVAGNTNGLIRRTKIKLMSTVTGSPHDVRARVAHADAAWLPHFIQVRWLKPSTPSSVEFPPLLVSRFEAAG